MAFHYSLGVLLRVALIRERREEEKLTAIILKMNSLRAQIENSRMSLLDSRRLLLRNMTGGLASSELQFAADCDSGRALYLEMLGNHMQQLEQQRVAQSNIFQEARQKRGILENYRERQLEIYVREQNRREQQRMDDLFLIRLGHSNEK